MATVLSDRELEKPFGTVILDADGSCLRPNSYVLRLGASGEFLNAAKTFELGKRKKGIKIQPGHSVAVTAHETLDFRRETVHKLFPGHDLHGFVSPTTDLSREGIVAPTTQVDAGYHGTLNWTLANTSNEERRFIHKERIFRLTIFKLAEGETPDQIYQGDYQGEMGYVRSQRKGAPSGMREQEWEDSIVQGGPETLLDNFMKSGYPWHALGQRLKIIDQQFKSVTDEYGEIRDSIDRLTNEVDKVSKAQADATGNLPRVIRSIVVEEAMSMQNRWLIGSGTLMFVLLGLVVSIVGNQVVFEFTKKYSSCIGLVLIIGGVAALVLLFRRGKNARQ